LAATALVGVLVRGVIDTDRELSTGIVRVVSHVTGRAVVFVAHVEGLSDLSNDEVGSSAIVASVGAVVAAVGWVLLRVVLVDSEVGYPAGGVIAG